MTSNRLAPALVAGIFGASVALAGAEAGAQEASRLALRGEVGLGPMLSDAQRDRLDYQGLQLQATGRVALNVVDWLSLQLSVNNGFFFAPGGQETGRTLALQGGLRLEPWLGRVGRVWLDGNAGLVMTGDDRRFGFDAGVGFEFRAASWLGLGPMARFHLVTYDPQQHVEENAMYLSAGVSFTLRVPGDPAARAPADADGDGVLDADDLCPREPQGAHPDPARRGCPRADRDGDGVFDDEDQCATTPAGDHPDPARRGCPTADTDGDGVFDPDDQCVTTPAGDHPDPARRGCPDGDDDNDAVLNSQDQCRAVHAGYHPDPARPGCPLPDRDRDSVPDQPDHCPDQPGAPSPDPMRNGCPGLVRVDAGVIRINRPVFFATGRDTILRTSFPVLQAVGDALRATGAIRRVSIEGHTDDVGDDAANMDLSNRRAASVMRWLTENGIDAARLEAHGFGETRPVRDPTGLRRRQAREARAANRRVEFRIVDPAQPPASQAPTAPASAR